MKKYILVINYLLERTKLAHAVKVKQLKGETASHLAFLKQSTMQDYTLVIKYSEYFQKDTFSVLFTVGTNFLNYICSLMFAFYFFALPVFLIIRRLNIWLSRYVKILISFS